MPVMQTDLTGEEKTVLQNALLLSKSSLAMTGLICKLYFFNCIIMDITRPSPEDPGLEYHLAITVHHCHYRSFHGNV